MRIIKTSKFKSSQYNNEVLQEYETLQDQAQAINITGTGQSESIAIPGGGVISAGDLLYRAKGKIAPILVQNGVREIDTSPISNPMAQGLAISHEPGKIHIDVQKIFNQAKQALPATSQLDAVQTDPDIIGGMAENLAQIIEAEITETLAHESQHVLDYTGAYQEGNPFTSVQEHPAEQFGRSTRQRYFNV